MTKRERELVAEALRLAQAGVCVGQGKASLNGVSVPGMDVVIFFHDEPRELCQVLKKLRCRLV